MVENETKTETNLIKRTLISETEETTLNSKSKEIWWLCGVLKLFADYYKSFHSSQAVQNIKIIKGKLMICINLS